MLAPAVQDSRRTPQIISWLDEDGRPLVLTGATITGRIESKLDGTARAIDGNLSIYDGPNGMFEWEYGVLDVGEAGFFFVQFIATFGVDSEDRTLVEDWEVVRAL